jgi:putative FmdB family regulatory protein
MPLFDFKCDICEKIWETLQFGSNDPDNQPSPCPHCGSEKTTKQISGSLSFSIKGPGVYASGFSSSKSNKRRKK